MARGSSLPSAPQRSLASLGPLGAWRGPLSLSLSAPSRTPGGTHPVSQRRSARFAVASPQAVRGRTSTDRSGKRHLDNGYPAVPGSPHIYLQQPHSHMEQR